MSIAATIPPLVTGLKFEHPEQEAFCICCMEELRLSLHQETAIA